MTPHSRSWNQTTLVASTEAQSIKPEERVLFPLIHSFVNPPPPQFAGGDVQTGASYTNMVRHSFFQLVVLVTSLALQAHCGPLAHQIRGACATEDPDENFLSEVGRLKSTEAASANTQARRAPIEIETWFHIVSSKPESSQVTDDMTDAQVSTHRTGS